MKHSKTRRGQDDHRAIQDHELDLIVRQMAGKPLTEFDRSEDRPDEEECGGGEESIEEVLEALAGHQIRKLGVAERRIMGAVGAVQEFEASGREEEEGGDLDGEAGDEDVGTCVDLRIAVSDYWFCPGVARVIAYHVLIRHRIASRYPATSSLNDQAQDVATQEYRCVRPGPNPTDPCAIHHHDPSQREIDPSREEDGSNGERNEVPEEVIPVKRIAMQEDACDVSEDFGQETKTHGDCQASSLVFPAQEGLGEGEQRHEHEEESIACD